MAKNIHEQYEQLTEAAMMKQLSSSQAAEIYSAAWKKQGIGTEDSKHGIESVKSTFLSENKQLMSVAEINASLLNSDGKKYAINKDVAYTTQVEKGAFPDKGVSQEALEEVKAVKNYIADGKKGGNQATKPESTDPDIAAAMKDAKPIVAKGFDETLHSFIDKATNPSPRNGTIKDVSSEDLMTLGLDKATATRIASEISKMTPEKADDVGYKLAGSIAKATSEKSESGQKMSPTELSAVKTAFENSAHR